MKILLIILLPLLLISCGLDTREHYFELEDFSEGKVYYFSCEEDSLYDVYLKIKSEPEKQLLSTTTYGFAGTPTAEFVEKYKEEGSELVAFSLLNGEAVESFKVIENDVFKWAVTDEPFSYSVTSADGMQMTNTRNYFTRAHMDIMGEKYEVLGFKDVISYTTSSISFTERKYYAEGMGLVGIELEEGDQVYHLRLSDILSMKEWKDRF
ncbi:hypothetical protein [Parvicella tangerina]|uniref:Lipoprotein n=1 Tax=Parvicella tangerina TaxID=2829795 RepID=A0A916JMK2_9FLAO|nr:hypothetical protein [Parvicella tangerina]CAG5082117.1 hypothetical protein CRYO30217_01812 [Parvicella tangerina]